MIKKYFIRHWAITLQIGTNSIVGYIFLKILAMKFGLSEEMDGFNIAYSIPFIILNISGFSFLHGIIATQFSKMIASGSGEINEVFSTTLSCMLCLGMILLVVCIMFSKEIAVLFAPGLSPNIQQIIQKLLVLMCPIAFTLGIATYLCAVLFAYSIPIVSEFSHLITRLGVIIWMLLFEHLGLVQIATGLVVSSFIGLIIVWYVFRIKTTLKYKPSFKLHMQGFRSIVRQSAWFMAVAVLAQASMFYMRRLATLDGPGVASAIIYALSLISPLSLIIGKPLAQIIGPKYIEHYTNQSILNAKNILFKQFLFCTFIGTASVVLINLNIEVVIGLLYGGGKFDIHSINAIVPLMKLLNWALIPAILMWVILVPVLNIDKINAGAKTYGFGYALHICFSYLLFYKFGKYGLAYAYVIGMSSQALLGLFYVYRDLSARGTQYV